MKKYLGCLIVLTLFTACSSKKLKSSRGSAGAENIQPGAVGAGDSIVEDENDGLDGVGEGSSLNTPPGLHLVWKRYRALEDGLMKGLNLSKTQVCAELGRHSCVDNVHLSMLGGNEPYRLNQYIPADSPTALTPVAVDRVVLDACSQRLELDRTAGAAAQVFKFFPLTGAQPSAAQIEQQTQELYRRLLAREAEDAEKKAIAAFASKVSAPDKLALSLCLAIGSQVEGIFL